MFDVPSDAGLSSSFDDLDFSFLSSFSRRLMIPTGLRRMSMWMAFQAPLLEFGFPLPPPVMAEMAERKALVGGVA